MAGPKYKKYLGIVAPINPRHKRISVEDEPTKNVPKRMTKTEYYLEIALAVSRRSTCLKRHYGAIIVNNDEIVSTGYNGSPRGEVNCCDLGRCKRMNKPHNSGDYSDCCSVHAEQNAMLSAARKDMIGATLYIAGEEYALDENKSTQCEENYYGFVEVKDAEPCPLCYRMIQNAGITRIINRGGEVCMS